MTSKLFQKLRQSISDFTQEETPVDDTLTRRTEIEALILMNCGPRKTRLEKLLSAHKIFAP